MILTVESVEIRDRNKKETQYVMKLKGTDENYVEATLTLKSDSKRDLSEYAPMMVGERRLMRLSLLDRTQDEFTTEDDEKFSPEEIKAFEERDRMLEKRKQAAVEQAGGE